MQTDSRINIIYVDSESLENNGCDELKTMDAILVPGGFGDRGIEGKILAAKYARENNIPYFGICLGLQIAVIEYARHRAEMKAANSTEFNEQTAYPVVALVGEWQTGAGKTEKRDQDSDLGGTMRLGGQQCKLVAGTLAHQLYGQDEIVERHRHRYEVNGELIDRLTASGLIISGRSIDGRLVEMIELPEHRWFLGCQFHPEFTSNPRDGHPLFTGFIKAALGVKRPLVENEKNGV